MHTNLTEGSRKASGALAGPIHTLTTILAWNIGAWACGEKKRRRQRKQTNDHMTVVMKKMWKKWYCIPYATFGGHQVGWSRHPTEKSLG